MKRVKGSSIKLKSDVNISADKVLLKGKKSKTYEDLKEPYKDMSKDFERLLPMMLGAMPVMAGVPSEKDKLMLKLMGSLAACAGVKIIKNQDGSYSAVYTGALNRVRNNALPADLELSDVQLKEEIYKIISKMLEKNGPAFASWNELLKDLMKNNSMEDFLKGARGALCAMTGDPVNANTGNFTYSKEDIILHSKFPIGFIRSYNSSEKRTGVLGKGWRHSYEISISREENGYILHLSDGQDEAYFVDEEGRIHSVFDDFNRLKQTQTGFIYNAESGLIYLFDKDGKLLRIERKDGEAVCLSYDSKGRLLEVSGESGSKIVLYYNDFGKLREIKDHTGRKVEYSYEGNQLGRVYIEGKLTYSYYYKDELLEKIKNPRGIYVLENLYDGENRVKIQKFADGGIIRYEYNSEESKTFVINQNGNTEVHIHDENFRNIESEYAGESESFTYDTRNLLTSYKDKKGNITSYEYDKEGKLTKVTFPDNQSESVDYDSEGNVAVHYINGEEIEKYFYDDKGRIIESKNTLGESTKFDYSKESLIITLPDNSKRKVYYDNRGNISGIEEENGKVTTYEYDNLNRVIASIDGEGNKTGFSYNERDLLTSVKDALGNSCRYNYTENGKLSLFEDFRGGKTKINYNELNNINDFTLPDGETYRMEYDLCQNLIKEVYPDGGEVEYTYNAINLVEKKTLQNKGEYKYHYDANGNLIKIIDPLGDMEEYSYDERNRLISYRDKSGEETEYEYGKHSLNITNNLGTHKIKYDILGRIILETDVYGFTREYEYNELGKIKKIKSGEFETLYDYYKGGLLQRKTYPDKRYEIFTYDKNLNVVKRENEKGDYVLFTYDKLNRLIEVKNNFSQKQSFEYDAMGNVIKETDTMGHVTKYNYSLGGKLISVIDAMGNRTEYNYDKVGRLITVYRHEGDKELISGVESANNTSLKEPIDAVSIPRVTRYKRDLMGNIVSVINALGYEETFSYDLLGRVTGKKDREGYNTAYSYTEAGDIKSIIYNDGKSVEYTYNSLRQLSQVKDALGTINIESDKFGRATKVVDYTGDEVSYRYGKYGERLKTVYPDGKSVSYEYDEYLRLTSLTSGNKRVDYTYDKEGRLIRKDMSDEVSSIYKYNERGLLSSLRHLKENRKVEEYTYDYDLLGNKTKIVKYRDVSVKGIEDDNKEEIIHRLWQDSGTFNYSYDSLNRLVEVKRGDRLLHKYAYDAFGNRTLLKNEDKDIRYTYDALDRLIKEGGLQGSKIYEYDKRGNLIGIIDRGKRVRVYEYDTTGRLGLSYSKSGKARSYSYDGLGNRIGFKEYEKQIGYGEDGLKSILEENLSELTPSYEESYILDRTKAYHNLLQNKTIKRGSQAIQSYVWDFNVAYMGEGEKEFTYLQDELGSTIRLLEQGGESQAIYGYDEFGEDAYNTQGQIQPFGYTGYRYDNVADTYFAQAREYVPRVGRFAGEDKDWFIKFQSPESINLYTYCVSNPLIYVDKTGFDFRSTVGDYFGKEKDIFGLMIGEHWMVGTGKDIVEFPTMYTGENGPWGQYMMKNPILTGKVGDLVIPIGNKVKPGGSIDVTLEITHMVIENGENAVGYQFLHGTNEKVGGFKISGNISKSKKGDITYMMTYAWNDIIDPNFMYATDIEKSNSAKENGFFTPKDYEIHLTWYDTTIIREREGEMFWQKNSGWLRNWNKDWDSKLSGEYKVKYNDSENEQAIIGVRWEKLRNQIYSSHPMYYCNTID